MQKLCFRARCIVLSAIRSQYTFIVSMHGVFSYNSFVTSTQTTEICPLLRVECVKALFLLCYTCSICFINPKNSRYN